MWLFTSAFGALPLPIPRDGVAVGIEVARGSDAGDPWGRVGIAPSMGGSGRWVRLRLGIGGVSDATGLRGGIVAPGIEGAVVGDTWMGGMSVSAPWGTPGVSHRRLAVSPWIGATTGVGGGVRLTGQAGVTWASGGRPIALPGPDPASLGHGGTDAAILPAAPPPRGVVDPATGPALDARGQLGLGAAAVFVDLGVGLQGPPEAAMGVVWGGTRGQLSVAIPIVGERSGLIVSGEVRIQSPSR